MTPTSSSTIVKESKQKVRVNKRIDAVIESG